VASHAAIVDQLGDIDATGGLRERLAMVPDPRSPRGLRHSLMSILLITICALSAGKNSYTTIEAWAKDAPPAVLDTLDVRFDPLLRRHMVPDESTIRNTVGRVNPDALAATGSRYLADLAEGRATVRQDAPDEREARRARTAAAASPDTGTGPTVKGFAIDGKRLAGARRPDGSHVTLLSMVEHGSGTTAAQREIPAKTNEVPEATGLLAGADVRGAVVTLDALHTVRATADAVITDHDAAYLMIIKANQPNLLGAVAARFTKPNSYFRDAGQYFSQTTRGHGRVESREIRVASAEGIDFPHAAQVFQIIRRGKTPGSLAWERKQVVFGVTKLPAHQAGPADLAEHARNHWTVENKSHYVRDVTFREDANQTRTGHAPANLASLRNIVTGAFRRAGHTNIAHARSLHANSYERVVTLFNLRT
jgi:predicted transposase YbfD/YdcC